MHRWKPPLVASTVGSRVVVSDIVGDDRIANRVRSKLFELAPTDSGRQLTLVDGLSLPSDEGVALVSATDNQVNDLALASLARSVGASFLLCGELIEIPSGDPEHRSDDKVTISWRLTPLVNDRSGGGFPLTVDRETALRLYPDLKTAGSTDEILIIAAARETYRLMTPSLVEEDVALEVAFVMPGSRQLREGNALASSGRWWEAERVWAAVREEHPLQIAAIHNLAIAAAARQDFSEAKALARKAVQLHSSELHQKTLAWIETRQRVYHESFDLPDPPEGWFLTKDFADIGDDR